MSNRCPAISTLWTMGIEPRQPPRQEMKSSISRQAFIRQLAARLLFTPILLLLLLLFLSVFLVPVFENRFSDSEILLLLILLSLSLVILFLWLPFIVPFIRGKTVDSSGDRFKIEQVARIIMPLDLNFEEAELVNKVKGWAYKEVVGVTLSRDQLRVAFELARKDQHKGEALNRRWVFTSMILSFLMAPFGFAGLLHWRSKGVESVYAGVFCLTCGFLLLFWYVRRCRENTPN